MIPDSDLVPSLAILEAEMKERDICRWYRYFADDGPYDRRRYPKHMAFFAAGATYRQRMFLAGNRCLTANTPIDTVDGRRTIEDLYLDGQPFRVFAWTGNGQVVAEADAPVRKPKPARCYHVHMSDHRAFMGSHEHRVLTRDGWVSLSTVWKHGLMNRVVCIDGTSVARVTDAGVHDVYDFTVDHWHNYLTAGVIHHNTGKSDAAAYELTCHLTGLYPHWWVGKRFETPIEAWASGDTANTTRNILQVAFLGPILTVETKQWCGMIPRRLVRDVTRKQGIPSAIQTIWVHHASGGVSTLDLLSYDQKREAFQGTAKHVILLDEEPPADIYAECLIRTMTTGGLVLVTMTPLMGLTPFVAEWLERSVLEVLRPDGTSELQQAKSAVFGRENG